MKIVYTAHPALHTTAVAVPFNDDITPLIDAMWSIMYAHNGAGLAANQVGVLKRVIMVHVGCFKQVIINPIVMRRYGGRSTAKEGCLSYPGLQVLVVRDHQIAIKGFDQNWKPIKRKLKGLAAYCVQHEIDHLNGITIGDK